MTAGRQTKVKLALTTKIDMPRAGLTIQYKMEGWPLVCGQKNATATGPAEVFRFFFPLFLFCLFATPNKQPD